MLNRISHLLRDIDEFGLSISWLLCWPVHVWNWAARAQHLPMKEARERNRLISVSFGGFGVLAMCAPIILLDPGMRSLVLTLALYLGPGIQAVLDAIKLSREYLHSHEVKLLEYRAPLLLTGPKEAATAT